MSTLSTTNNNKQEKHEQSLKSDFIDPHLHKKKNIGIILSRRYEELLHTEKYWDCIFHIGDASIKCHKLILSAASPVFEAMFYGPMCEQQQKIEILDISTNVFKLLIEHIYVGVIDFERLTIEHIIELYYGAEKYFLNELINDCLSAIMRKLRFENILPALELSVCMNLDGLLEVCMTFFARCCLADPQFMTSLKTNYIHVSKDCIKTIIEANRFQQKYLHWFVCEWCLQECHQLGLEKENWLRIYHNFQLSKPNIATVKPQLMRYITIERSYYKACRPFVIDNDEHEWHLKIKCDRFILLRGLIMLSRLTPNLTAIIGSAAMLPHNLKIDTEYNENFRIQISSSNILPAVAIAANSSDEDDTVSDHESSVVNEQIRVIEQPTARTEENIIWQHSVQNQLTKYNCDLNISWDNGVILSPDIEYKIKLIWDTNAYGAEYPCSLQSNFVDGIHFNDTSSYNGSPIKGIHYINLV